MNRSRPVHGELWKELVFVRAKKGSISGRQNPDVWVLQLLFRNESGRTMILKRMDYLEKEEALANYTFLVI